MSAALHELPMLAFDVETTGVVPAEDRMVTAAVCRVRPDVPALSLAWLVDPGVEIPEEAAAIHGVSTDHAREHGADPATVLFELTGRLALWMGRGFPLVAYNAAFDLTILEAENVRHGIDTLEARLAPKPIGPVLDPMVMDKQVDRYRPGSRTLSSVCEEYGVLLSDAHDASADAAAAVQLARAVMVRHADAFRNFTLGGLHVAQRHWRYQQQLSLRQAHRRQGKESGDYDGSWPVHAKPSAAADASARELQGVLL